MFRNRVYRNRRLRTLTVVLVIFLLVLPLWNSSNAAAQNIQGPKWSISAMGCVPTGATTAKNMVQMSHGNARYMEGKTGRLYLICPVTDASLQGTSLQTIRMTFRGKDVSTSLKRMDRRTGEIVNLLQVSTPCLTNSIELGDPYTTCSGGTGNQLIDFTLYYYYVQFSLNRSSSNVDVRVVGASLW